MIHTHQHVQHFAHLYGRCHDHAPGTSLKVALQGFRCEELASALQFHDSYDRVQLAGMTAFEPAFGS